MNSGTCLLAYEFWYLSFAERRSEASECDAGFCLDPGSVDPAYDISQLSFWHEKLY